jgi:hypothetical protein
LLGVADVDLTVDVSGGAIEVGVDSEDLVAVAVEGLNKVSTINGNLTEVSVVLNEIEGGGETTALAVLLNADGEVESPAAIRLLFGSFEAELLHVDGAVV